MKLQSFINESCWNKSKYELHTEQEVARAPVSHYGHPGIILHPSIKRGNTGM